MLSHTCPVCRAKMDLDAIIRNAVEDAEARRLIEFLVLHHQPTVGAAVIRYLRLFSPPKNRLSWRRAHTILREIVEALKAHKIVRKGREWRVTVDDFEEALKSVFEAVEKDPTKLPLPSNAYLWEVLRRRADSVEAQAEKAHEQTMRTGPRTAHTHGTHHVADVLATPAAVAQSGPQPAVVPPAGPSPYAQKVLAEIAERKARRAALRGESTRNTGTDTDQEGLPNE